MRVDKRQFVGKVFQLSCSPARVARKLFGTDTTTTEVARELMKVS